jgi:hypothetical protein
MQRKTPAELEKHWNEVAAKALVGRTIVAARYMTEQEASGSGWMSRAPVLVLDDGSLVFPQRDDEGNDAGALYIQGAKDDTLLPVL